MNKRENLLRALRRDNPERVPFDFDLCPSQIDNFEKRNGTRNFREFFDFPMRYVELNPTKQHYDYSKYYEGIEGVLEPIEWNPEWGRYGPQRYHRALSGNDASHAEFPEHSGDRGVSFPGYDGRITAGRG